MEIKNPVLRYLASSVVLVVFLAVVVLVLHGIGSFAEPWYAQDLPYSYAADGYSFATATFFGAVMLYILVVIGFVLNVLFLAVRGIGNRFLGPPVPVEDAAEE